ncbi:hypothetical protein PHLGIDRAFT_70899 [Phlebiopsis gigantea 11061_1 CR5-6]|uniref:Threonine/serine exporter-like N-terminal domain-containing protein n=1 Tax=Phlebiopsis gigantea (strain 11061_1 CR5-6) TaxID=745531 RepID=A0A0C3S8N5_PHLG1|nr:hypothetical protein PHLGIDRAFT_70899 [Phlebiopsis gigantea 11061_1 CR5-6]
MTFGAPSHRIEAQLISAAHILDIEAEFVHVPNLIMCSFIDKEEKTSETHFIRCGGRMALGRLHEVHQLYRAVVHDELSAKKASDRLDELLTAPPIYGPFIQCSINFWIAALICPLAFGGSIVDMWIAGAGAVFLSALRIGVVSRAKKWYAHVFEYVAPSLVCLTTIISFTARALSSIKGDIFCYNAISSASIVSILPGFLILSGSLELAAKNLSTGSIKMIYALIYTMFLGFGLQIGNDFNATSIIGTFTFLDVDPFASENIITGCYRAPGAPWYLQPFPWWTQFIIVPVFSILSSLANLQPIWTWDMVVMVVISCCSYTTNKIANSLIRNRSDFVSFTGAFAVGLLGNFYSRKMGGTAFTVMVTGVLFLVPSGLSAIGGITAQGSGIDIGGAMISVTIGITTGLFVSQAIVYAFGSRKNNALFSF